MVYTMIQRLLTVLLAASLLGSTAQASEWRLLLPRMALTVRINPMDSNKLFVGGWSGQAYRSEDGGKTWVDKEIGSLSSGSYLSSLYWSSADTSVLYCGGFLFTGIQRSEDGGDTWTRVLFDSSLRHMWYVSEAIIEDPKNPNIVYAGRGRVYNTLYRSTNTGLTWDSLSVIPIDWTGQICTISLRPDSTNIIFAGCKGGVITRSDDGGLSWQRCSINEQTDSIRPDTEIPKIVFSTRDPQVGYAIAAIADERNISGNGGVLKTTDGGWNWNQIAFVDTSFWAVESRPLPSNLDDEVFVGGFRISTSQTIVKGDSLVYNSMNGGQDWTQYRNVGWGANEVQDTIRNVWSIRWDSLSNKVYMATQVGLYVLDEAVSVDEDIHASAGLSVRATSEVVTVVDDQPLPSDKEWAVYAMDGRQLLSGTIGSNEVRINAASLPQGRYLLTWGSDRTLRTALFSITR